MAAILASALVSPLAASTAPARADAQTTTTLAGSTAPIIAGDPSVGLVAGSDTEAIEVWMAGDQAGAQAYADAVSTPGSSSYGQFLSPGAYSQKFGPSAAQVQAVSSYLTNAGFTGVQASTNDDYISATAPVSVVDQAFSVQMRNYQITLANGQQATIQSNDRDLVIPASIAGDVLSVTGLDGTPVEPANAGSTTSPAPASTPGASGAKTPPCSHYWAQNTTTISPAYYGLTKVANPVCGYSASQIRAAYGLNADPTATAHSGAGKTIALIQIGGPTDQFQALTDYAKANGLPAPRSAQYREEAVGQGGSNPSCVNQAEGEAQLDSEAAYAMAPGADQLMVDGDDCDSGKSGNQSLFNALLAPLTGNGSSASAAIESVSYFLASSSPSALKTTHAIALRAADEGVSLLFASGDAPGVQYPASDPDVTAVGGTTLGIGKQNQRLFETGWSTDFGARQGDTGPWTDQGVEGGAGGGATSSYAEPAYQQGAVPSSMSMTSQGTPGRTTPDISAEADPGSGLLIGMITLDSKTGQPTPYTTIAEGGTSQSTPLVAGIVADAEQGQKRNLGFLNPLLYSLAGSSAYRDIQSLPASAPQVDRAYYKKGGYIIAGKFGVGYEVWVNDATGPGTSQVTAPGYDTVTGLGVPNGVAFLNALNVDQ